MYEITFNDGEVWQGSEPEQSKWNGMPLKPIKKISYNLLGHTVTFEGYEAYNHLVERTHFILNNNEKRISKIFLMAKKNNIVYICIFDLFSGEIYPETTDFEKEYYGKKTSGWKPGLLALPVYYNLT